MGVFLWGNFPSRPTPLPQAESSNRIPDERRENADMKTDYERTETIIKEVAEIFKSQSTDRQEVLLEIIKLAVEGWSC